jgi:hypothetical protein
VRGYAVHRGLTHRARLLSLVAVLASCASTGSSRRDDAAVEKGEDCQAVRDEALRACVDGFKERADELGDEGDLDVALYGVCPYAGAVAWTGCRRGAFETFKGHSEEGYCGDRADFIESSIETSCVRHAPSPIEAMNVFLKSCFDWAVRGGENYRSECKSVGRPVLESSRQKSEMPGVCL